MGAWPATVYEQVLENVPSLRGTVTLPAAIAMSGAAVSPEMGKMTLAPLRFLLTMANVRLGVWIPNPDRLSEFEARQCRRWRRSIMQPRLTYLCREMFGRNLPTKKFLYVTDGGHYENLGLLEQLRRRSQYIFCLDASGEQQDGFSTIAGAVALAYSELGIRIDITPETMAPDPKVTAERAASHLPPVVRSTFCVGDIHYPDGLLGRLVVIKTGVPVDAPLDVADFQARNCVSPAIPPPTSCTRPRGSMPTGRSVPSLPVRRLLTVTQTSPRSAPSTECRQVSSSRCRSLRTLIPRRTPASSPPTRRPGARRSAARPRNCGGCCRFVRSLSPPGQGGPERAEAGLGLVRTSAPPLLLAKSGAAASADLPPLARQRSGSRTTLLLFPRHDGSRHSA